MPITASSLEKVRCGNRINNAIPLLLPLGGEGWDEGDAFKLPPHPCPLPQGEGVKL